jgi:hypothetical protein
MHYYEFNNTIDIERASDTSTTTTWGNLCEGSGTPQQIETYVNKNNVFYRATTATNDPTYTATNCATTGNRRCLQNNICTQSQTGCTTQTADRTAIWGSNNKNAGTFSGPESYVPVSGTPVYESTSNNPCDPDGDGVLGVDWNHDGVNDLVWTDIRGYVQDCSSGANPTQKMSLGAVQPFNDAVSAPVPTLFRGARLRGAKI